MCHNLFLLELSDYLFNFNFRVLLTVTVLHAIALAALLLEDDDLVALDERFHDFYYYFRTFYGWCTYCDCALVIDEQHLVRLKEDASAKACPLLFLLLFSSSVHDNSCDLPIFASGLNNC